MGRRFKPRRPQGGSRRNASTKTLRCPICKELIPLNEYREHIRRENTSADVSEEKKTVTQTEPEEQEASLRV
jgi:hypothetical protein